jgi:hypothetical protein
MIVCSLCIHKASSQYLNTTKWLAYGNQEPGSKSAGGAFWVLTAPLVSLCTVLAVEVVKVGPQVGYPEMLPLGKGLLTESAVHVAL